MAEQDPKAAAETSAADPEQAQAAAAKPLPATGETSVAVAVAPVPETEEAEVKLAPIIVKKIIDEGHGGAHGGAWKIALADMMTAMMAFFLLMWLLGASNADTRKSIADYFKPTNVTKNVITANTTSGSVGLMGGMSIIDDTSLPMPSAQTGLMQLLTPRDVTGNKDSDKDSDGKKNTPTADEEEKRKIANELDQANFEKIKQELTARLAKDSSLSDLKNQVNFVREREGLRIEIIDKADFSMFGLGTSRPSGKAEALIAEIARTLKDMPNKIKVRGHTDSIPYNAPDRNNWSLSAERAEVTRQIIGEQGLDSKRFAKIEGVADTEPFNAKDGLDPRNRRISITLMHRDP